MSNIAEFLTTQPVTKKALAERAGVSPRKVEMLVNEARREGAPIVSDHDGYRLTDDPTEVLHCSDRLESRFKTQAVTVGALRRTAERMSQRLTLWSN